MSVQVIDRHAIPLDGHIAWLFGTREISNEHFASIAGYTSAGFPFGVRWEEWERCEESDPPPRQGDCEQSHGAVGT